MVNDGRNQKALVDICDNTSWTKIEHFGLKILRYILKIIRYILIPVWISYPWAADV